MNAEPIPYIVLDEDGAAVNVVLWDGVTPWNPGKGLRAIPETEYRATRDDIA
ncbi:hypothetical protein UFOVP504_53 [uncultured Caudovirales phage]|uniref:Uncharacterized protein n=1 Tax=uncultured Caudovirales phage TaxID=2100421 RepID=A0A6J5MPF1_9CAUD|nr:hypothetical protein UFOVP504_53 [uncultured Caudovirales phage]CAB4178278.1 hypothetical protein UFOVP1011_53 [uncultured Caudovirales phage]CAB4187086.1 hypothetical protein UFOVP1162_11 [uncultured Caudovirales phage]CAB4218390.1 hypothetical protein UFOVP1611_14 [uncultured Caudovirales phage]